MVLVVQREPPILNVEVEFKIMKKQDKILFPINFPKNLILMVILMFLGRVGIPTMRAITEVRQWLMEMVKLKDMLIKMEQMRWPLELKEVEPKLIWIDTMNLGIRIIGGDMMGIEWMTGRLPIMIMMICKIQLMVSLKVVDILILNLINTELIRPMRVVMEHMEIRHRGAEITLGKMILLWVTMAIIIMDLMILGIMSVKLKEKFILMEKVIPD